MTDARATRRRAALLAQEGTLPLIFETMDRDGHEYAGDLFSTPEDEETTK